MPAFYVDDIVVSEGDGFVDIVVRLDAPAEGPLTVNYSTANGTADASWDYTAVSGTLNFAAGEQFATVRVNLLQSATYDTGLLEHFRFNLSGATGGATIGKASAMVTIIDNDNAVPVGLPSLYVRDVVVDEKAGTGPPSWCCWAASTDRRPTARSASTMRWWRARRGRTATTARAARR